MNDTHHCPIRNKDGSYCEQVLYKNELEARQDHLRLAHPEVYEFISGKEWFLK